MAGLKSSRLNYLARSFAESLLREADELDTCEVAAGFAEQSVTIRYGMQDPLSQLVSGAFLPASANQSKHSIATVTLSRSRESASHPDLMWAESWINRQMILPTAVTHPYRIFFDRHQGLTYVIDTVTGNGVIMIRRESELDMRSFITPFRLMLSWIAGQIDAEIVHGAAIVHEGSGILLSGPSGSGKSTLALAAAVNGFGLIADDCVLVSAEKMYPVYSRVKVDSKTSPDFHIPKSALNEVPHNAAAKSYIPIQEFGDAFQESAALEILGFPAIRGTYGTYRISRAEAQRMLVTDSLREVFGGNPRNVIRLTKIAAATPGYRIVLGDYSATGEEENVRILERMISNG